MKYYRFLTLLIALLWTAPFLAATEIHLERSLPKPDSISFFRSPGKEIKELNHLLGKNELPQFYKKIDSLLLAKGKIANENLSADDIKLKVWLFYYVSASPLLDLKMNEKGRLMAMDNDDLETKFLGLNHIDRLNVDIICKKYPVQKSELTALLSRYYAHTIRSLREAYIPNLKELHEKELYPEYHSSQESTPETEKKSSISPLPSDGNKSTENPASEKSDPPKTSKLMGGELISVIESESPALPAEINKREENTHLEKIDPPKIQKLLGGELGLPLSNYEFNLNMKMASERSRNSIIESRLRFKEPSFVELLIKYYPGKAAEVKKYIKLAGYTDEKIPALIDRTVGRDAKTEFLYKGRKDTPKPKKKK